MLEEESAKRVEETEEGVVYSLDRLGVPLVEIGTGPDIRSPEGAREAAERIGMLLRSTGAVKRGLGTIRQDVNVSIADGARVEVKGVQDLQGIEGHRPRRGRSAGRTARNPRRTGRARRERRRRARRDRHLRRHRVRGYSRRARLGREGRSAVPLFGFDGLVGREIQPDRRLGTELSDHAKRHGAGGIFHTDELPAYGVTEEEVAALRDAVGADGTTRSPSSRPTPRPPT